MDIFLIGLGSTSATKASEELAASGYEGSIVGDWSALTDDDTFWGVIVGAPHEVLLSEAPRDLGLNVRGVMPLRFEPHTAAADPDITGLLAEMLPAEAPAPFEERLSARLVGGDNVNIMSGDGELCVLCGWIDEHAPDCPSRRL